MLFQSQVPDLSNELLFKILPIIDFGLVQVNQKEQKHGNEVALHFQVLYMIHIKKDVTVNLIVAEENAQYLQVFVVLNIRVRYVSAFFAMFQAVVFVLQLPDYFGQTPTLNTYKSRCLLTRPLSHRLERI